MSPLFDPELYRRALFFAADAHGRQTTPDARRPYVVHVVAVSAEVLAVHAAERWERGDLAVACALLHDVLEDTATPAAELAAQFGAEVADGVAALTKDALLPKSSRMADSLRRIRLQPREVWCVKLADRIVNLAPPPSSWTPAKIERYREEAVTVADALGDASPALHARLREKIAAYGA